MRESFGGRRVGRLQRYGFAYGQTGSGKTYTMGTGFDVEVDETIVGIIPRAIRHLFNGITDKQERARERAQMPPEFKVRKLG